MPPVTCHYYVLIFQKESDGKKLKNQLNYDLSLMELNDSISINLKDVDFLEKMNNYLMKYSYFGGYSASQLDCRAYDALQSSPSNCFPHILRWYNHISTFGELRKNFPQVRQYCHPAR